jgi:hypothetical protein
MSEEEFHFAGGDMLLDFRSLSLVSVTLAIKKNASVMFQSEVCDIYYFSLKKDSIAKVSNFRLLGRKK